MPLEKDKPDAAKMRRQRTVNLVQSKSDKFYGIDDGDGQLCFEEFLKTLPKHTLRTQSEDQLRNWFDLADADQSGQISMDEFFMWTISASSKRSGHGIADIFAQYDRNKTGTLDKYEFCQAADDMGFGEVAIKIYESIPVNQDGSVDYMNVVHMMTSGKAIGQKQTANVRALLVALSLDNEAPPEHERIDTSGWSFGGRDLQHAHIELRQLLAKHEIKLSALMTMADKDGTGLITFSEFKHAIEKSLGFTGPEYIVYEMFDQIDTKGRGKLRRMDIDTWLYDRSYEDMKPKVAISMNVAGKDVRRTVGKLTPGPTGAAMDRASLNARILALINHSGRNIADVMGEWDKSGDGQISKREFLSSMKRMVKDTDEDQDEENWKEMKDLCIAAFEDIDRGNDGEVSLTELQKWLGREQYKSPQHQRRPVRAPSALHSRISKGRSGASSAPPRASSTSEKTASARSGVEPISQKASRTSEQTAKAPLARPTPRKASPTAEEPATAQSGAGLKSPRTAPTAELAANTSEALADKSPCPPSRPLFHRPRFYDRSEWKGRTSERESLSYESRHSPWLHEELQRRSRDERKGIHKEYWQKLQRPEHAWRSPPHLSTPKPSSRRPAVGVIADLIFPSAPKGYRRAPPSPRMESTPFRPLRAASSLSSGRSLLEANMSQTPLRGRPTNVSTGPGHRHLWARLAQSRWTRIHTDIKLHSMLYPDVRGLLSTKATQENNRREHDVQRAAKVAPEGCETYPEPSDDSIDADESETSDDACDGVRAAHATDISDVDADMTNAMVAKSRPSQEARIAAEKAPRDWVESAKQLESSSMADALLVFGTGSNELSSMLAQRTGGTIIDLTTLAQIAHEYPSEDGEALLVVQQAGALPPFKVVLPLIQRVMATYSRPYILNGYPRMSGQLQQLQTCVGKLALAVQAGTAEGMDARLALSFENDGTLLRFVSEGKEADVDEIVAAMQSIGIDITSALSLDMDQENIRAASLSPETASVVDNLASKEMHPSEKRRALALTREADHTKARLLEEVDRLGAENRELRALSALQHQKIMDAMDSLTCND